MKRKNFTKRVAKNSGSMIAITSLIFNRGYKQSVKKVVRKGHLKKNYKPKRRNGKNWWNWFHGF